MTPLFTDAEITASIPPPKREDWFIILAMYQGSWKMPYKADIPLLTAEAAQQLAANLSSGWSNIRIVRIHGE